MRWPDAWSPLVALAVLTAGAGLFPASAAPPGDQAEVPQGLADATDRLREGLQAVSEADGIEQARQQYEQRVKPHEQTLLPHASDLADRDGDLLTTYLDRLADQLAEGNLTDARSLAQAAANHIRETIRSIVLAWEQNRTSLVAGSVWSTPEGPRVSLVLIHPPPAGIAAFDASLHLEGAIPVSAQLSKGQGQAQVDATNATVRWASFDAASLAGLDASRMERIVLGEAQLDGQKAKDGSAIGTDVEVNQLVDPNGKRVPVIGLAAERSVPEAGEDPIVSKAGLAMVVLGVAGAGLVLWVRRWEV